MTIDCGTIGGQVLQLRGEIRARQKELQNCLDTCTDNCDECTDIEKEIKQLQAQLVIAEKQQATCALLPSLLGSWTLNANGFILPITIDIGWVEDIGFLGFHGYITPSGGTDSIEGSYNNTIQPPRLVFTRVFCVGTDPDNPQCITQDYTGYQFANPTGSEPLTFAGTFLHTDENGNTSGPFGWYMIKQ